MWYTHQQLHGNHTAAIISEDFFFFLNQHKASLKTVQYCQYSLCDAGINNKTVQYFQYSHCDVGVNNKQATYSIQTLPTGAPHLHGFSAIVGLQILLLVSPPFLCSPLCPLFMLRLSCFPPFLLLWLFGQKGWPPFPQVKQVESRISLGSELLQPSQQPFLLWRARNVTF